MIQLLKFVFFGLFWPLMVHEFPKLERIVRKRVPRGDGPRMDPPVIRAE